MALQFNQYVLNDDDPDSELHRSFGGDDFGRELLSILRRGDNFDNYTYHFNPDSVFSFLRASLSAINLEEEDCPARIMFFWKESYPHEEDRSEYDTLTINPFSEIAEWGRFRDGNTTDMDFSLDELKAIIDREDMTAFCGLFGIKEDAMNEYLIVASEFDYCCQKNEIHDESIHNRFKEGKLARGLLLSSDSERRHFSCLEESNCEWDHVRLDFRASLFPAGVIVSSNSNYFKPIEASKKILKTVWGATPVTNPIVKGNNIMATTKKIVDANKSAAIAAGKIEAGRIVVNKLTKLVAPKLPLMMRGYADTALGKVVIANVVNIAVEQYAPDNEKAKLLAEAAMQGAALELIQSFNVEELLEQVTAGISIETLRKAAGQAE